MKKPLFACLLMVLTVGIAKAQVKIIPKAGLVFSQMDFSDQFQASLAGTGSQGKPVTGFSAGAAFEIGLGDVFSVQPEILFSQKGFDVSNSGSGQYEYVLFMRKFNYVEVPLLFQASFGDEDALRFSVFLGPYVGYAVGGRHKSRLVYGSYNEDSEGKIKFGERPANYTGNDTYYVKEMINRLDLGVYAGGGVSYPLGPGAIALQARYGYGLANVGKAPSGQASKADLKSQHRTIGVFLGYSIPLGN